MPDPIKPTAADWQKAVAKTNRLQRDLDISNADHIALWLEANTIPDEPMSQCISWLACRIVEAHEAAAQQAREQALEEAAKVADAEITRIYSTTTNGHGANAAKRIRNNIRALKEQPPC